MALFKDICYLGNVSDVTNDYGDTVETIVYSKQHKFIDVKSVGYKQFYEAQASGYKPEIAIKMRNLEYNLEEYVLFNDVCYKVIRTYLTGTDYIELTLQREVNKYRSGVKKIYLEGTFYLDGGIDLSGVYK